jgi:hypothetical protein
MYEFTQADMLYNDYRWQARPTDNPNFRMGADYHLLNRSEGYEMLYAINNFLKKHFQKPTKVEAQHAERLIRTKLPANPYSHTKLYEWLAANWTVK